MESLINKYIQTDISKANKFLYWIEDYVRFLSYENKFDPKKLRRYKRGEIVKAHLGYNIGSEEGGLHYCIVLDSENHLSSPTLTVIPLTSVKEDKDCENLKKGEVFLGQDLREKLEAKANQLSKNLHQLLVELLSTDEDALLDEAKSEHNSNQIKVILSKLELLKKITNELQKMKIGSIALVGQITTISKIRVYDPKTDYDVLAKIRISNENLDAIDKKVSELFQKQSKKK